MPARRSTPAPPPPCPDRTGEAWAALRALDADPTPETAAVAYGALRRACDACGSKTCHEVTKAAVGVRFAWLAEHPSRTGSAFDHPATAALHAVMFGGSR